MADKDWMKKLTPGLVERVAGSRSPKVDPRAQDALATGRTGTDALARDPGPVDVYAAAEKARR